MAHPQKILFIIPSYQTGGTTSALKNLLPELQRIFPKASFHIFALSDTGEAIFECNSDCIIPTIPLLNCWSGNYSDLKGFDKIKALLLKSIKRISLKFKFDLEGYTLKKIANRKIFRNYDVVIGYQEGLATRFASYIKTKNKIAWLHCDLRYLKFDKQIVENSYQQVNKIICVSNSAYESFYNYFPYLKDKASVIYNFINRQRILELSKSTIEFPIQITKDNFIILSVGRLDPIKQFSKIPFIASQIIHNIPNLKWLIVGGGCEEEKNEIEQQISQYNVHDHVIMTGYLENPYPLFRLANLYVCTSKSEACPMVFLEANILNTYIISNSFSSAYEIITNGMGEICQFSQIPNYIEQFYNKKRESLYSETLYINSINSITQILNC